MDEHHTKLMSRRSRSDPLQYENAFGAKAWGTHSYRMRYDMQYSRKVQTFFVLLVAAVVVVVGVIIDSVSLRPNRGEYDLFFYGGMAIAAFSVVFYVFFPIYFRYDIGSTVAYCRRQLGTSASDKKIRACVERRENNEDIMGAAAMY